MLNLNAAVNWRRPLKMNENLIYHPLDVDKKHIGRDIAITAQSYGLDALNVMFLTPLLGTRLWEEMESHSVLFLRAFPMTGDIIL